MPSLNVELDFELNSDVDKVFNYLVRLLRNRNITQYIENHPAAYNEVLAAVQEIPQPKALPTPASTPQQEPESQADQQQNGVIDPLDRSCLAGKQQYRQEVRPSSYADVEDAGDSSVEQTSDDSQPLANLDFWRTSGHTYVQDTSQDDEPSASTVTSLHRQRLYSLQRASSKRNQHLEDRSASKRVRSELADTIESGPGSSTRYPIRWTYEGFALRFYLLVPSLLWSSDLRDMAIAILTRVLGASQCEDLDKYQLGLTEILFCTDIMAFLENLRTTRLNHCATVIQKNLKAKYYRHKYLETRNAILLIQFVTRRHLAWKRLQEIRKSKAATTIKRLWRGRKERKSFNAIRNSAISIQAAAKGFLRRREFEDTRIRKAAVLIQRVWRLSRHMMSWRRSRRKIVIVQSLWRGKCSRRRYEMIRQVAVSDVAIQEDHENDRIAELPTHWQTQLQRIKNTEVLEDCQHFCYMVRNPVTCIDVRPDRDALEGSAGPDDVPTKDRRLKQLKFLIEDGWEKEKSLKAPKLALQVSKRVHLVELTAKYMAEIEAEKATPKKRGRPSVKERFTDLLFPHTIKYKGKKARKRRRDGQVSSQKGQQVSEGEVRERAEKTFEYWIRLGKPLFKMFQRYGVAMALVLPKELTEASLHALRKGQDQDVLEYIDSYHPGLKEQISSLSSRLPSIIATGLPSQRLLIETIPYHELSNHSFEELFQCRNIGEPSKLSDLPPEEPSQPPRVAIATIEARQAVAVGGPSSDQGHANEQLPHTQSLIEPACPDHTSESIQSRSSSVGIKDEDPSNYTTDCSEFAYILAHQERSDHHQEPNQQSNRHFEDPSSSNNVDQYTQQQPSYGQGFFDLQDYYDQDNDNWRAEVGESPDPQDYGLQRSSPSEAEFSDFDLFINCSP